MNNITRLALLAVQQRREGVFTDRAGICTNFEVMLDAIAEDRDVPLDVDARLQWLKEQFKAWPKYSGNDCYPVPHPDFIGVRGVDDSTLGEEFQAYHAADEVYDSVPSHWATDTPYGQLRAELLAFLIERAT